MAEDQQVKSMILLVELANGDVHQAVLTTQQEDGIKALLKALPDNVQLLATKLDLTITRPTDQVQSSQETPKEAPVPSDPLEESPPNDVRHIL